jgi:hypothetical protein
MTEKIEQHWQVSVEPVSHAHWRNATTKEIINRICKLTKESKTKKKKDRQTDRERKEKKRKEKKERKKKKRNCES